MFWNYITSLFIKTPIEPPMVPMTKAAIDINAITAALIYLKPLGTELIAFEKAWQDKDLREELLAGEPLIEMIIKVLGVAFPQLGLAENTIGILTLIAPIIVEVLLKTGNNLVPDGQGGWVSKDWADNPIHALNPDGSFKYPGIFGYLAPH